MKTVQFASKYIKVEGYDVVVDNSRTDQHMYTPKLLPRFGPEIEATSGQKSTIVNLE